MSYYAGRRGPPKTTPTSVLCQKCLKRGHYSYECKVALQDRPYKTRPSRSQQFRNPKLAPKLHEDTFNTLQQKKGVADEELAKREAERGKSKDVGSEIKRGGRSVSYSHSDSGSDSRSDSRSSISAQSVAASPRPATMEIEPPSRRHNHSASPASRSSSRSPRRSPSADPVSPPTQSHHERNHLRRRRDSKSPDRSSPGKDGRQHYRQRDSPAESERQGRYERQPPTRQQSLSPFSKRLALTQENKK